MNFGAQRIFDGFDLTVMRGERLAILGASGCGKSTLLRCIARLEKPQAGTIEVAGQIGFVFQEPRLFPWLTVEGNVRFAARNEPERARVSDVLQLVGLSAARTKLPKELSGGMAQRAALARTLVRAPDVILLDEPLAALDALRRLELRVALREIMVASGATAILVTHDVDEALDVGSRQLVLERTPHGVQAHESPAPDRFSNAFGPLCTAGRTGRRHASSSLIVLDGLAGVSYTYSDVRGPTGSGPRPSRASVTQKKRQNCMGLSQPSADVLDYHERPDEDLVSAAKSGDNLAMEFLLNKYKNFVRIKAKSYFLIGADREDIIQEGMIGLYKAVRDFKADKLSSFRAFAELCITRQIITAIKTATRQKHIPLNQYISLNKPIYDEDSERTLLDVMPSQKTSDPEELVINQEVSEDIKERIQENLSDLESQVLLSYLEGKSYQEMARDLNRHVKSIDNALQRVKRKIEKNLSEIELP